MKQVLASLAILFTSAVFGQEVYARTWQEFVEHADSLRKESNYDSAVVVQRKALAIVEERFGPEDSLTAEVLFDLAAWYNFVPDYDTAIALTTRALEIFEKVLGPNSEQVAGCLSNLAFFYSRLGRYDEHEELLKHALAIRETVLGPGHPDVGMTMSDLAFSYRKR
jgi:tetratricopeptide (TPR) repeat protein